MGDSVVNSNSLDQQHTAASLRMQNSLQLAAANHFADQQMQLAAISRASGSPHYRARTIVAKSRGSAQSNPITISDPNDPSKPAFNGLHRKDGPPAEKIERQRSMHGHYKRQDWAALDMGGLSLRNIGKEVFRYTFLEKLYMNHNHLTALSPSIAHLKLLRVLDISSNNLTNLPSEIGMLTALKSLLLFDNQIASLPAELGSLYQLEVLGVEGNPLAEPSKSMIMKEGTRALIAHLRDSCPVPLPPPERDWMLFNQKDADESKTVEKFSVLSYNVLCEKYATSQMYGYTPSWALSWSYRKQLILQEILLYEADIVCLQEVDVENFEEYFSPQLAYHGYKGVYWPKTRAKTMNEVEKKSVDGCATFFKTSAFALVDKNVIEFNQSALRREDFKKTQDIFNRVMNKDNIAVVCLLESRKTGTRIISANAHIHWDPAFKDVKLVQVAMLMEELSSMAKNENSPIVICGDFNSIPSSGVYQLLSEGRVTHDHEDLAGRIYGKFSEQGMSHQFGLRSAYSQINELKFTNYTPGFSGVIDYIWYSAQTLELRGLLGEVDESYLRHVVAFPNAHFPSE